jgi:hypothetical protein
MGKVGSTTILRSLESLSEEITAYQIHWLVPERLRSDERLSRAALGRIRPTYIWAGQVFSRQVKSERKDGSKWKIITLVRDPIARNVSAFFENLELIFAYDYHAALRSKSEREVVADLIDLFLKGYVIDSSAFEMDANPLTWFEEEFNPVLEIDIYQRKFPTHQGYDIFQTQRADLCLLRMEDLDVCGSVALGRFLGVNAIDLRRGNIGSERAYSNLYERFKKSVKLPESYLDAVYGSRLCKHFYSEDEIAHFKKRWMLMSPLQG